MTYYWIEKDFFVILHRFLKMYKIHETLRHIVVTLP